MTVSDTDRAIQHNPDMSWPDGVMIELIWTVDGKARSRHAWIHRDEFFGLGAHGAPIEGAALVGRIENLRRMGPPTVAKSAAKPARKKVKNAKKR